MHKALVLSVPGTGSRFTLNFLEACLGYQRISPEELLHKPAETPFCALQHVNSHGASLRDTANPRYQIKTVIPLRAPVHQFITRLGVNAHANRVREECKTLWKRMREVMNDYDHVLLPVEVDMDRRARLEVVMRHLGATPDAAMFDHIIEHWTPVGSGGVKSERLTYDRDGDVSIAGFRMGIFDDEMAWYRRVIHQYTEGLGNGGSELHD